MVCNDGICAVPEGISGLIMMRCWDTDGVLRMGFGWIDCLLFLECLVVYSV